MNLWTDYEDDHDDHRSYYDRPSLAASRLTALVCFGLFFGVLALAWALRLVK